jgi:hypothetical protein
MLTIGALLYVACLPLGRFSYQRHLQADATVGVSTTAPSRSDAMPAPPQQQADDERPTRLN